MAFQCRPTQSWTKRTDAIHGECQAIRSPFDCVVCDFSHRHCFLLFSLFLSSLFLTNYFYVIIFLLDFSSIQLFSLILFCFSNSRLPICFCILCWLENSFVLAMHGTHYIQPIIGHIFSFLKSIIIPILFLALLTIRFHLRY